MPKLKNCIRQRNTEIMRVNQSLAILIMFFSIVALFSSCTFYIAPKEICYVKILDREINDSIPVGRCKIVGKIKYLCLDMPDGVPFKVTVRGEAVKGYISKEFQYPYFEWELPVGEMRLMFKLDVEAKSSIIETQSQEQITLDVVLDCVWIAQLNESANKYQISKVDK